VDDRPEDHRMASCYNCGYAPLERGSLCPHCAVRSYAV
jgi:NMD protein affecting ribosome stability and mRNA decay